MEETVKMDLRDLREQNISRANRWHGENSDTWTLADWSNAMCGEAGEAANIVKKIRRHQTHVESNYNTPVMETLLEELESELADLVIYADLLAHFAEIDLGLAIVEKFNAVSKKQKFPERIGLT